MATRTLILLRHGQSEWNARGIFTGWADVPLSDEGRVQAAACGRQILTLGLAPDVVHTSHLRRAVTSANIVLDIVDRHWIPAHRSWRLNERCYGALEGLEKKFVRSTAGVNYFDRWRRSWDAAPPPLSSDDPRFLEFEPGRHYDSGLSMPHSESLRDVYERVIPYWESTIAPTFATGARVLVVAHGSTLRALIKHLDELSDDEVSQLNVPTGMPLVYELNADLRPDHRGGRYIDPEAAARAASVVANEGR